MNHQQKGDLLTPQKEDHHREESQHRNAIHQKKTIRDNFGGAEIDAVIFDIRNRFPDISDEDMNLLED